MSFYDVLDLHTQILTRIGRDYIKTWGPLNESASSDIFQMYTKLKDGAYYVLSHLEEDDEWYDFPAKD